MELTIVDILLKLNEKLICTLHPSFFAILCVSLRGE